MTYVMNKIFRKSVLACALLLAAACGNAPESSESPLDLEFHRLAVRRYVFSNNLMLSEFVPSEVVAFESMHPAFVPGEKVPAAGRDFFHPVISGGRLRMDESCGKGPVSFYVGGVNPYATYEVSIHSLSGGAEVGFELARLGLGERVQLIAGSDGRVRLRVISRGNVVSEKCYPYLLPSGEFILRAQLYGKSLGVFVEKDGCSEYVGHLLEEDNFGGVLDFRDVRTAQESTFNVIGNLVGVAEISSARSYLSSGVGQADMRLVTYDDLTPYWKDDRLWFTFSCRGIGINQSAQGVMSLDPSVFEPRLEGMIVYDHGDGLLRNDYSTHLFFDRKAGLWRAWACDFGGTAFTDERSGTGLLTTESSHCPLKGFSVMKACRVENEQIPGHNEDPCIFYDGEAGKWRLLTSVFLDDTIVSGMFESDNWDGPFERIAGPISLNSTGTTIQKVGNAYYCFMGGSDGNLRIHSYPELELLGELNLDLQPHWPDPAGRVWANIVPLPEGYPYRYVLMTMDRPNFPGITSRNWSYGACYYYGAL